MKTDPRGFFFDLYGTLLIYGDTKAAWGDWLSVFHRHLSGAGLDLPIQELAVKCDGFFSRPEPPVEDDGLTVYGRRIRALGRELGVKLDVEETLAIASESAHAWQKYVPLDPEAVPVLEKLRTHKTLALISNYDHPPHVVALLDKHGLAGFFATVVISANVGYKKPDPRIFAVALSQTGLRPEEVAYVGDTVDDMTGAYAAGLQPILIRRNADHREQSIDDYVASQTMSARDRQVLDSPPATVITALAELIEIFT